MRRTVKWEEFWARLKGKRDSFVHCTLSTVRGIHCYEQATTSFKLQTAVERAPLPTRVYLNREEIVVGYLDFDVHLVEYDSHPSSEALSLPKIQTQSHPRKQ